MFPFLLVFGSQNLFQPVRLSRGVFLVRQNRIVENHELFSAALIPEGSHIPHFGRSFSRLPLLDRD